MIEYLTKIGIRVGVYALVIGGVIGVFSLIQIPGIDLSVISSYIDKIYTIGSHYMPGFSIIWGVGVALIDFEIALILFKVGGIAERFLIKVNE